MCCCPQLPALIPERLVRDRDYKLKLLDPPFPTEGFAVGMVWHEGNHAHRAHRWIRIKTFGACGTGRLSSAKL
jgi:DNA-binding transcriptional LysR family regulator